MRTASCLRTGAALVGGLMALGGPGVVSAQSWPDARDGSRIRIELPDSLRVAPFARRRQFVIGTLVRSSADSFFVQIAGANPIGVARNDVRRMSVSRGASKRRSAFEQAAAVAAMGMAIPHVRGDYSRNDMLLGAAIGAGVGALVGALSPYEHWRRLKR
jgi:hypothetical protein